MSNKLRATALVGPTGAGKSALAVPLVESVGGSIICCDSMQLYRSLDIGTAKPTAAERTAVAHFLVDCCSLPDLYSAARWAEEAREVIRSENSQGRTPLIVGGTGFYLKALLDGFAEIPEIDTAVRELLELLQREEGVAALYERLQQSDAEMAARLRPSDSQRIMRALCVLESTGRSLAEWQDDESSSSPEIECPVFVLDVDRVLLREKIAKRFHAMMDAGWLDEVKWLASLNLPDTHPAMRAVGYRQLLDHLGGSLSLEQAVIDGITATRRYAKRQVTWFNHQVAGALHGSHDLLKEQISGVLQQR